MAIMDQSPGEASTTELVRGVIEEAKELVRIEVALAKDEVKREAKEAKAAGIAFGSAAIAALLALGMLLAALVVVIGPIGGLIVGSVLLTLAGGLGFAGYKLLPKKPLDSTRKRLEEDVHSLKERMA